MVENQNQLVFEDGQINVKPKSKEKKKNNYLRMDWCILNFFSNWFEKNYRTNPKLMFVLKIDQKI